MKKKIFTLLALFAGVLSASAENTVTVSEALIPAGKSGSFSIELSNPGDAFCAFQMDLKLPSGITFVSATKSDRFTAQSLGSADQGGNVIRFTSVDTENNDNYLGESGALFTVTVSADAGLTVGDKLDAQLLNMEFTRKNESAIHPDAVDFNIEITDKVILDETSTVLPAAQDGVDILVKRTIKKDVWNTICLPFKMTKKQIKDVFGADVQFGTLRRYEIDGNTVTVNFKKWDWEDEELIKANTPYIIKTTTDITSFSLSGVSVNPNEAAAVTLNGDEDAKFIGTLYSGKVIPADHLFLNANKIYYSKGSTTIKGFRGYFWLKTFNSSSASEFNFEIDGEATNVEGINIVFDDGQYYNLKGQKVDNPTEKGVYIKNGKKVVIK